MTEDIDLMKVKQLLESPSIETQSDYGWLNMIRAFPLQRNLKQGLVSNTELFDLPVPPKDIPADNPNCVYRMDTHTWTILPEDNFKLYQPRGRNVIDEEEEDEPVKPRLKLRSRSFKIRGSLRGKRKPRLSTSSSTSDLPFEPKISDDFDVEYGLKGRTVSFQKTEESPILRRRSEKKVQKVQIEIVTGSATLPTGN